SDSALCAERGGGCCNPEWGPAEHSPCTPAIIPKCCSLGRFFNEARGSKSVRYISRHRAGDLANNKRGSHLPANAASAGASGVQILAFKARARFVRRRERRQPRSGGSPTGC